MSLAVIVGPSGIGKSTLAIEFLEQWESSGQTGRYVYVSNLRNESFGTRKQRFIALLQRPLLWLLPAASIHRARRSKRNFKILLSLAAIWARGLKLNSGNPHCWVVIDQGLFVIPNPVSKFSGRFLRTLPDLILVPFHDSIEQSKCRECRCESNTCIFRRLGFETDFRSHWSAVLDRELLREWGAIGTVLEKLLGEEIWVIGRSVHETREVSRPSITE